MIVIIDYGMGNLNSVLKAVKNFSNEVRISSDLNEIKSSEKLILQGVGHFENGIKKLKSSGIWDVLNKCVIEEKKHILGICLGMQLMLEHSEEGNSNGFGWIKGKVVKFVSNNVRFKIPHMGWNTITLKNQDSILNNLNDKDEFYFVHSYYACEIQDKNVLCTTEYYSEFVSGIYQDNIYGLQFHPEKSHLSGKKIIENFVNK